MTETTSSIDPNQEIIQSLLAAKIQEIIAVSTIYQYLFGLYAPTYVATGAAVATVATTLAATMASKEAAPKPQTPTSQLTVPILSASLPMTVKIPEIKPEDEIVVANSSTDAHGDLLALLQPMLASSIIKLVEKQKKQEELEKSEEELEKSEEELKVKKQKELEELEKKLIYINLNAENPFTTPLTKAEYDVLSDEDKVFCFPIIDVDINTKHKTPYIFLGDALDRGEFSINCLLQLIYILRKQQDLITKGKLTEKIFTALLGNHEIAYLFKDYKLILHKDFVAKLPGFIRQEIVSKEIFKKILIKANIEDALFYESYHSWIEKSISTSILNLLQECDNVGKLTSDKIKEKILEGLNKLIFLQDKKYDEFKNNLADSVSEKSCLEIQKKIEYIDAISNLMWQNIDLFDFCKAVKIKEGTLEEKTFVYSHANLPLNKIKEFLTGLSKYVDTSNILSRDGKNIDWIILNKLFKIALKQFHDLDKLKMFSMSLDEIKTIQEEQSTLYGVLSSLCSTRPGECVVGYYYKSPNIINITGHTIRVEITCENLLYILTDTGSSYWFRLNCPSLNTVSSGTTLTQNGNVYMNFYDLLSLMQDESGEYSMEIISNTRKKQLIYSPSQIAEIKTPDPLQESIKLCSEMFQYLNDDGEFNNETQFNTIFNEIRLLLLKIPDGEDKSKLNNIIIQTSAPKEMKQKFKQYICQYYNTECFDKLKSNVINLDDIIKYGEVLFKLLNDDGNYKYEDTTIFSNLFTAIRMSVMSSSKISNQEQLLKIFDLSRINDLEKRKQAKDQFQKFLEGLERQSPTSPSLPPR